MQNEVHFSSCNRLYKNETGKMTPKSVMSVGGKNNFMRYGLLQRNVHVIITKDLQNSCHMGLYYSTGHY